MRTFAALAALALAALPGCEAKRETGKKKLVVGFSQVGAESAWRTAETKSIRDAAAKRGADL